jgi:hypothetical protein
MNLGDKLRDRVTGFEGIAVARTEWLNGCVRFAIQPHQLHEGKVIDATYFDAEQLEVVEAKAVQLKVKETGGDRVTPARAKDDRR